MEILLILFLIERSFTPNRQDTVFHMNIDRLRIDTWKVEIHNEFVLRLVNIGSGYPVGRAIGIARPTLQRGIKQSIHLILEQAHFTKGVPSNEIHSGVSSLY